MVDPVADRLLSLLVGVLLRLLEVHLLLSHLEVQMEILLRCRRGVHRVDHHLAVPSDQRCP